MRYCLYPNLVLWGLLQESLSKHASLSEDLRSPQRSRYVIRRSKVLLNRGQRSKGDRQPAG